MSLTVSDFDRELAKVMSEKDLSQFVVDMAQSLGWRCHRTWNSMHSPAGFPDLVMVRKGVVIFAELKSEKGRLSVDQMAWISDLQETQDEALCLTDRERWMEPTWSVHVWRPSHWLSGEIERVLRGGESERRG